MPPRERSLPDQPTGTARPDRAIDPILLAAAREVDRTLLAWSLALSPRERLRSCTAAARAVARLRRD
ncbi:MAG: hypothetical protein R2991_01945 [Thermoanaerobaculia bacterium]